MAGGGVAGFLAELKRRRVIRAGIVYAAVAWVVIEVADTIFPRLGLPDWTITFVVALAALGMPIVLVLAWAFELSPEGVRRTEPSGTAGSRAPAWVGLGIIIAIVGVGATVRLSRENARVDVDRSIAVLPFTDMSPQGDQSYLADGITEDILTKLAVLPGFRVPSRTSVMQYKGTTKDMRAIGQELGVAWILEGSVRRDGERVKITGQLIRTDTDQHVWADNYERPLHDIFAVQNEIAERIADALEVELTSADRDRIAGGDTDDPEAYELYLRGREILLRPPGAIADLHRNSIEAAALFRQALEIDSTYALAYVGLANTYWGGIEADVDAQYDSSVAFSRRAIRLEPELADGYAALGFAYILGGQWDAALDPLTYALELNPSHADALQWLAMNELQNSGRLVEARRTLDKALAVYPGNAELVSYVALVYYLLGDFDRAEHWFRRSHEVQPNFGRLHCELAHLELLRGNTDSADAHLRDMLAVDEVGTFAFACAARFAYMDRDFAAAAEYYRRAESNTMPSYTIPLVEAIGDPARLREVLIDADETLADFAMFTPVQHAYEHALIAAWRGEKEEALRRLELARDHGYRDFPALERDAAWDALRDDPRFRTMIAELRAEADSMRTVLAREGF